MSFRRASQEATVRRDPMQEFANRIVEQLEKGVKPWVRPWDPLKCDGPQSPFNMATGHRYSGINVLILGMHPAAFQSGDPRFCTYKQAQDHQWQVNKGEHGTTVLLYKPLEIDDDKQEDGKRVIPLMRTFTVFHPTQMTGVPPWTPPTLEQAPWRSDEATDIILKNSGVAMRIGGDRAFYSPKTDHMQFPPSVAFNNAAEEACVRVHELGHATGAAHRLNRDLSGTFGSKAYAFEELIAETASSFIGMTLNIPTDIPNHINYIGHWLSILKEDKKAIFRAAAAAQKAADWILNLHPDYVASHIACPERAPPTASPAVSHTAPA
jgi:antirestriction protein ArdC